MDKFLTESKKDIIAVADQKGLGEVIKPLSREIHLFDTYIAGTSYLKDPEVLEKIKCGDKLLLQREDNKFDNNAILVFNEAKEKLGYVPERDNIVFARLMDAGKLLCGKIKSIEPKGSFRLINIEIYLIDF
ncbi:MAG: HIRAN domain-containing protein [Clostridiales bacterium]|nr:HIRAN domain-containing protein [Clostridiales bacterium]